MIDRVGAFLFADIILARVMRNYAYYCFVGVLMHLMDTHCHLDFDRYDKDRDKVIKALQPLFEAKFFQKLENDF